MSANQLNGTLPPAWGSMNALTELSVDNNQLQVWCCKHLPAWCRAVCGLAARLAKQHNDVPCGVVPSGGTVVNCVCRMAAE
jgi:hypothetical protein